MFLKKWVFEKAKTPIDLFVTTNSNSFFLIKILKVANNEKTLTLRNGFGQQHAF
jgi:hypothetical protein